MFLTNLKLTLYKSTTLFQSVWSHPHFVPAALKGHSSLLISREMNKKHGWFQLMHTLIPYVACLSHNFTLHAAAFGSTSMCENVETIARVYFLLGGGGGETLSC